ncbi:MAG: DDE-type integrase/transposase/recombinase, partial [Isoptericola variabilis]|nr:DDE-type integrase/transposase/recombinase [Isoptericola variabilis]
MDHRLFAYLRCAHGWVYLCAVRDAHSRRVLGYAMGEQHNTRSGHHRTDMAAATCGTFPAGVVLHADRGTQFTSQKLAASMRAVTGPVSMGQAGVCWDNAMAESLWATLTTEYYYRRAFTTRDQVY